METKIPGLKALHAIVTPRCQTLRGEQGACDEALERLRRQYQESVKGWGKRVNFHLVLTIERIEGQDDGS